VLNAADFVAYYQKPREKPRRVHLVAEGQTGLAARCTRRLCSPNCLHP
jgi:hypothetical protein